MMRPQETRAARAGHLNGHATLKGATVDIHTGTITSRPEPPEASGTLHADGERADDSHLTGRGAGTSRREPTSGKPVPGNKPDGRL
jgi:hypothetical protein